MKKEKVMFDKYKYDKQFDKENYWHMNLTLPKEYKSLIAEAASKQGMSKNAFVRDAINKQLDQQIESCYEHWVKK